jgi:hypothetical protein
VAAVIPVAGAGSIPDPAVAAAAAAAAVASLAGAGGSSGAQVASQAPGQLVDDLSVGQQGGGDSAPSQASHEQLPVEGAGGAGAEGQPAGAGGSEAAPMEQD